MAHHERVAAGHDLRYREAVHTLVLALTTATRASPDAWMSGKARLEPLCAGERGAVAAARKRSKRSPP
jgi:hypothetical protein